MIFFIIFWISSFVDIWCINHFFFFVVYRVQSVSIGTMKLRGLTRGIVGTGYLGTVLIQLVLLDTLWVFSLLFLACICTFCLVINFFAYVDSNAWKCDILFELICAVRIGFCGSMIDFVELMYCCAYWLLKPIMAYKGNAHANC